MGKQGKGQDEMDRALRRAAEAERRLLTDERRAERRLTKARARLADARGLLEREQDRVARRHAKVEAAETVLRERQAARAAGPSADHHPPDATPSNDDVSPGAASPQSLLPNGESAASIRQPSEEAIFLSPEERSP